ncbi:MAG: REP-associated tyrosine transposase [Chloroflexota bacterium]
MPKTDNRASMPHTSGSASAPPASPTTALPMLCHQDSAGWPSYKRLPHFDYPGLIQMISFRLADALPASKLRALQLEAEARKDIRAWERIEGILNTGYGNCSLQDGRIARTVEDTLLRFDSERYYLLAWVILPNHVHVLIESIAGRSLAQLVHSWKSFTAKVANKTLGRSGDFWQRNYFDRFIRDQRHFDSAVSYIHDNPVRARLVQRATDWLYSSARFDR